MLKLGIALFPWLLFLAVIVEASDGKPRPISAGLTRLRIEQRDKRVLASQLSTIALQVVLRDTSLIHPFAQTLIADKLGDADCLINGGVLLLITRQAVLVDQQGLCVLKKGAERETKPLFSGRIEF